MLSGLKFESISKIEYSPFVRLQINISEIDINHILELCNSERIASISFSFQDNTASTVSWDIMLEEIHAADIVSAGTYTGEGVRIGILEADGICDEDHINLIDKKITFRDNNVTVSNHATDVTSIIALMVPDATFFVSDVTDTVGLAWFIDNGCSIVNASFCYTGNVRNADGTYSVLNHGYRTDIDGVYDYQIRANLITVVVAAGNLSTSNIDSAYNPNNNVRSPGLAYNAITVGGVKRTWSLTGYNLEYEDDASYVSNVPYVKPEVSAFFEVRIPEIGVCSGTSFAAPQVTACIALLIDKFPTYFDKSPATIKAILMANAQKTKDYVADRINFDDRIGAGCIDLDSVMTNWSRVREYSVPAGSAANTQIASYSLVLTKGTNLQVSLSWYMYYTPGDTAGYITNYDIIIYDSTGAQVAKSMIPAFSNVEMLRYTVPADGSYRIVVYQTGAMDSNIPGEAVYMAYKLL